MCIRDRLGMRLMQGKLREGGPMRMRPALAFVVAAVAVVVSAALATTFDDKPFTCPLDGHAFTGRVVVSTNTFGGIDSDFCPWARGASPLTFGVQVCPECFYARRTDSFETALAGDAKPRLKAALANWRGKHPAVKAVGDLAAAQRWELAAVCAVVRHNRPARVGNLWLRAAWAKRHEGLATLNLALGDPMSSFEELDGLAMGIAEIKDAKERVAATFKVAMLSQRVGEAKRRDDYVKQLGTLKLDKTQTARLDALKVAFAEERRYQVLAAAAFRRAVDEETVKPEETPIYRFLIADLTRRQGKNAEALKLYEKVKTSGKVRPDIRRMCDFMINWLKGD